MHRVIVPLQCNDSHVSVCISKVDCIIHLKVCVHGTLYVVYMFVYWFRRFKPQLVTRT